VQSLRDAGLSLRAIASATGHAVNTVRDDLYQIDTPEPEVHERSGMDEFVDHATGEVIDTWPGCCPRAGPVGGAGARRARPRTPPYAGRVRRLCHLHGGVEATAANLLCRV
jgi:hypothetical protein